MVKDLSLILSDILKFENERYFRELHKNEFLISNETDSLITSGRQILSGQAILLIFKEVYDIYIYVITTCIIYPTI